MAGTYKKNPNIERDSAELAKKVREQELADLAEARLVISRNAKVAADRIITLLDEPDPAICLQASKHVLKLAGLEVERQEISGATGLVISMEHAQRVLESVLDEG